MTLKIEKAKYSNALFLILLYWLIFLSLALVVRDYWEFNQIQISYNLVKGKLALSFLSVLTFVGLVSVLSMRDFLYSVLTLILVVFVFPSAAFFSMLPGIDVRIFIAHCLLFLLVLLIGRIKIKLKFPNFNIRTTKHMLTYVAFLGLLPFFILYLPYINLNNLLLVDVYETRELMTAKVDSAYTNYTYSWYSKFIIPFLLVLALYFRDRIIIIFCTFSLVFLFLCGAHKAVFVGLVFTFLMYRYEYFIKVNYLLKVLTAIAMLALVSSLWFNNHFVMVMSIRRVMLLPALLDVMYFDFFDDNYLYWSEQSSLFQDYPYQTEHAFVIGEKYFGYPEWGANNGIISDGFMNFGLWGVLINIVVVAVFVCILNQLNISGKFFGLVFIFITIILSASLTTALISHGLLLLLLLALFFLKDTKDTMSG